MKSFPRTQATVSPEAFEAWNPPELDVAQAHPSRSSQKESVLAIFRDEENGENHKGKRRQSALHSAGSNQDFTAWQPGDMNGRPSARQSSEWIFLDVADDATDEQHPTQRSDFISGSRETTLQFGPEDEIQEMLQRARLQSEEIILAAQAEADHVILQAQTEIDEQKKEGYQQGWNDARRELEETLKATRAMVEEIGAWQAHFMSQGEQILVEMLKDIAKKMFGDGAELNPTALQINLSRIMESANELGNLNIFINPKDAELLDPAWSEQQMLITGGQVRIIPSANITRGGCYVKGNTGIVDGRVETQFGAILKTFDEAATLAE